MTIHDAMQVTVSLLPVSLALAHIPRSRLPELSHPVLRQLLQPNPTFLSVTCNQIELSLFAEWDMLRDFDEIAKKDKRRLRARKRKKEKKAKRDGLEDDSPETFEPVEVSHEKWNVLQIDSHSDRLDKSGARVHELSAPLALAGISILYQSSYTSDFLLVKSSRLQKVMCLLATAGFDLYMEDSDQLVCGMSPMLSPVPWDNEEEVEDLHGNTSTSRRESGAANLDRISISCESGAVLTRTRSSTDASMRSQPNLTSLIQQDRHSILRLTEIHPASAPASQPVPIRTSGRPTVSRQSSHSPTSSEVRLLNTDLTSVGLSEDSADVWGLKIIKLVAFPGLIPGVGGSSSASASPSRRESGDHLIPSLLSFPRHQNGFNSSRSSLSSSSSSCSSSSSSSSSCSCSDSESDGDDDVLFSRPPKNRNQSVSASSVASSLAEADDPSCPELPSSSDTAKQPQIHRRNHSRSQHRPSTRDHPRLLHLEPTLKTKTAAELIPFFSFTRTEESSSLTTDVGVLTKLFPKSERHMVICSGELDVADDSPAPSSPVDAEDGEEPGDDQFGEGGRDREIEEGGDEKEDEWSPENSSLLKCLQIDLRRYGLDKHGLVNRFSRVLEENGVNHMYSSTYKSANLLVDKKNAKRAQALLRSC
ncbi:hypothetical protein JAAARDRAFT_187716 [Jaapia argillacea MUCL 33604]|uniref:CASTOR ACT domain-containing protein n=1 Tax=Jaapia argillacea MUCL 33604 TaxID=933084 RepID=A0A067QBD6_9AGAM|nr:hypothetical protein JAAARDRAFT_187716 [Jaapia argillacea MUCL 33604]